jgi:RNA polymerase sigma-70 factor (ECF subfamily)
MRGMLRAEDSVTCWLRALSEGDPRAPEKLWPLVYSELRCIAARAMRRERANHTLEPTAVVHEAYLRMVDQEQASWQDRNHFYGIAARVMRHILVDHARRHRSAKRGGDDQRLTLELARDLAVPEKPDVAAVDEALTSLEAVDPDTARIVELRFFGGLTTGETAEVVGCSERTVMRRWSFARTWLHRELRQEVARCG